MIMYIADRISMSVRPIEVARVTQLYAILADGSKKLLTHYCECIAETPAKARYMLAERIRKEVANLENSLRFAQSRLAKCMEMPLPDCTGS